MGSSCVTVWHDILRECNFADRCFCLHFAKKTIFAIVKDWVFLLSSNFRKSRFNLNYNILFILYYAILQSW